MSTHGPFLESDTLFHVCHVSKYHWSLSQLFFLRQVCIFEVMLVLMFTRLQSTTSEALLQGRDGAFRRSTNLRVENAPGSNSTAKDKERAIDEQ